MWGASTLSSPGTAAEPVIDRKLLDNPVPVYSPGAFVQGLLRQHHVPVARQWATQARQLEDRIHQLCLAPPHRESVALQAARQAWTQTTLKWVQLSAVSIGPLIERRTARHIDFQPVRPALIDKAVKAPPADVRAMDTVGSPAKGLPALEWLLWQQPVQAHHPACHYAELVAADLTIEATAVQHAFETLARQDWLDREQDASALMGEVINQWLGAIEQLRWREIGKPLASTPAGQLPAFSRSASGQSPVGFWLAQWHSIRTLAASASDTRPPQDGTRLIAVNLYLMGRGHYLAAQALERSTLLADQQLQALRAEADTRAIQQAIQGLEQMQQRVQDQVAPALQISIGFSDSDGD